MFKNRILLSYIAAETAGAWVVGTISYILWIGITGTSNDSTAAFIWLVFPALIMLLVSPFMANFADDATPRMHSLCSIGLRAIGLFYIVGIIIGFDVGWDIRNLLVLGLGLVLVSALDGIFHAPVPFILAENYGVSLIRFRVMLMLLIRGANVITPTFELFLLGDIMTALIILPIGGLVSLISSVMLAHVSHKAGQENKLEAARAVEKRYFVLLYVVLLFALNSVFAHVTAIMLAAHAWQGDNFAYQNFAFFSGFLILSSCLIIKPHMLSIFLYHLPSVLMAIVGSLFFLSLGFGVSLFTDGYWDMVPLFVAGLTYGANLHFVTTILPTYMGLDKIYKRLNYGKIGATLGALLAGLWVAHITIVKTQLVIAYLYISIGAFAVGVMLLFVAIIFKGRRIR